MTGAEIGWRSSLAPPWICRHSVSCIGATSTSCGGAAPHPPPRRRARREGAAGARFDISGLAARAHRCRSTPPRGTEFSRPEGVGVGVAARRSQRRPCLVDRPAYLTRQPSQVCANSRSCVTRTTLILYHGAAACSFRSVLDVTWRGVGSSAIRSRLGCGEAIIARCRMPPENGSDNPRSAPGRRMRPGPVARSPAPAALRRLDRCAPRDSRGSAPLGENGLSALIGSWNIISIPARTPAHFCSVIQAHAAAPQHPPLPCRRLHQAQDGAQGQSLP